MYKRQQIEEGRPGGVAKSLDDAKGKALTFKKDLVAPNLQSGSYSGRVLAATSHHVLVTVDGRANTATVIEKAMLKDVKYREGELLNVQFKNGEVVPGLSLIHIFFRLAENVDRSDLSELDTARFIAGIVAAGQMKKHELAAHFGKKPAWVTRYLAFADDANYQKWVKPGYIRKAWILSLIHI